MRGILKKTIISVIILLPLTMEGVSYPKVQAKDNKESRAYFLNHRGQINEPIFNKDELLYPGKHIVKNFYIANNNDFNCFIKEFKAEGCIEKKNGEALNREDLAYKEFVDKVNVKLYTENSELFNGNAEEFLQFDLGNDSISIEGKQEKKFSMEIAMDEAANNSAMGINYNFSLLANLNGDNNSILSEVKTGSLINMRVLIITGMICIIIGFILLLNKKLTHKIFAH